MVPCVLAFAFIGALQVCIAFEKTPSLSPLRYVTPDVLLDYLTQATQSAAVGALLPVDQQDAVAIFISEGASGFLGGAAARVAQIIGGNKRVNGLVTAQLSGASFGVAGAVRSLAYLSGLSSISVNILALIIGFAVSESLKLRQRSIAPQQKRVGEGPTMYELMKFQNPSMKDIMKFKRLAEEKSATTSPIVKTNAAGLTASVTPTNPETGTAMALEETNTLTSTEISADLFKWIIFCFCKPSNAGFELEDSAIIGFVAGLLSQVVREAQDRKSANENRQRMKEMQRLLRERRKQVPVRPGLSMREWIVDGRVSKKSTFVDYADQKQEGKKSTLLKNSMNIFSSNNINRSNGNNNRSGSNRKGQSNLITAEDTNLSTGASGNIGANFFFDVIANKNAERTSSVQRRSTTTSSSSRSSSSSSIRSRDPSLPGVQQLRRPPVRFTSEEVEEIRSFMPEISKDMRADGYDNGMMNSKGDVMFTRFARSGLETAVQLLTYQASKMYVMSVAPYFQDATASEVTSLSGMDLGAFLAREFVILGRFLEYFM